VLGHSASGPERTRLQPFSKANLARIFGLLLARARLSTDTNTLPCLCLSVCLSCLLERSASHRIARPITTPQQPLLLEYATTTTISYHYLILNATSPPTSPTKRNTYSHPTSTSDWPASTHH
jgi:hypothetical protein